MTVTFKVLYLLLVFNILVFGACSARSSYLLCTDAPQSTKLFWFAAIRYSMWGMGILMVALTLMMVTVIIKGMF